MTKHIFLILAFFSSHTLEAQIGFNRIYPENNEFLGEEFWNLLTVEDRIITVGAATTGAPIGWWDLNYTELDTFGNILTTYMHRAEAPVGNYIAGPLIYTSDGLVVSTFLSSDALVPGLAIMNRDSVLHLVFYPQSNDVGWNNNGGIVETDDGYLFTAGQEKFSHQQVGILRKLNKQGVLLWEKEYASPTSGIFFNAISKVDANTFIISANKSKPYGPEPDQWIKGYIFAIDSTGNIKWEWESALFEETTTKKILVLPDKSIIYAPNRVYYSEIEGIFKPTQKLVRRDSAMNLIWERVVDQIDNSGLCDLELTPDGDIVIGRAWTYALEEWNVSMYKYNIDGQQLWARSYYHYLPSPTTSTHTLNGVAVLPSGSIIGGGLATDWGLPIPKSYGWLFKTDPDGCIDEACGAVIIPATHSVSEDALVIYPNPAADVLYIDMPAAGTVRVFDLTGRPVLIQVATAGVATVDVHGLAKGAYVVRLDTQDTIYAAKLVVMD